MLQKLKDLIYGSLEYEKVKFELRFLEAQDVVKTLTVDSLIDFEILESVIFKIEELLRLKSSTLNQVIKNPAKPIRKKHVLDFLDALYVLKSDFLKKTLKTEKIEVKSAVIEEPVKASIQLSDNVYLSNGKVPYILVTNLPDSALVLLKKLSTIAIEVFSCEGLSVIVEKNSALIIPRSLNDELIVIPKNKPQVPLSELKKLLTPESKKSEEFVEVKEPMNTLVSRKDGRKKDTGLDELLEKVVTKQRAKQDQKVQQPPRTNFSTKS